MKKDRKYQIPKKSKRFHKANVIYICSIITMFGAIGIALLVIPKNAVSTTVPDGGTSSMIGAQSSFSSRYSGGYPRSSDPEIRPITSSGTSEYSVPYASIPSLPPPSSESTGGGFSTHSTASDPITIPSSTVTASSAVIPTSTAVSSSTPESSAPIPSVSSVKNSGIPKASIPVNTSGSTSFVNGIAIVGTRAMALYNPDPATFGVYAEAVNKYKQALPDVNVYCLLIPTACEFYGSAEVNARCASQREHINLVVDKLNNVKSVDAYSALAAHINEDIYLRTDHHWAALGGYYAAREFAKAAGVPFLPLSDYNERVNTGYVGTMYGYTNNSAVMKNNPEDFVYHVPKTVDWTATYYNFKLSGNKVTGMYEPMNAAYFINYGDNSSDNYCTFMGGDAKIVHVKTSTKNGRRLAVFKESFGNTIPGYLFGSFEEIYVLDERYFPYNAIDFVKEKGITDLLFANNTTGAGNPSICAHLDENRTQKDMQF